MTVTDGQRTDCNHKPLIDLQLSSTSFLVVDVLFVIYLLPRYYLSVPCLITFFARDSLLFLFCIFFVLWLISFDLRCWSFFLLIPDSAFFDFFVPFFSTVKWLCTCVPSVWSYGMWNSGCSLDWLSLNIKTQLLI